MKYPMYSIKDAKVGFTPPTCDQSDQSAIRGFGLAVNNGDGVMNYSPNDFDLYKVGEFDSEKGTIEKMIPEFIVSASSLVNEK